MQDKIKKTVNRTRNYRKLHKWVAIPIALFMFVIGFTGLLLGWKKNVELLPPTEKGQSKEVRQWLSFEALENKVYTYAKDSLENLSKIDRIDVRPSKGMAKYKLKEGFQEIQIDLTTGKILSSGQRYSDIIEKIHDGSIVDYVFDTSRGQVKLFYTSVSACGLMLLTFSGFWLWYNPKRIKKMKRS